MLLKNVAISEAHTSAEILYLSVLAHNGGNKGINILVICCAIGAKSAIERDWPQRTCGQSPLTGSVFHGAI